MVHASTQQAVDRIVGTAAVIGLTVVAVRWLSSSSAADWEENGERKKGRRLHSQMPLWWPVIAMQRWNKQNRSDKESGEGKMHHKEKITEDNDEDYEHQGSCHCGSIKFVLQGRKNLQAVDAPGKIRYPHIPTSSDQFQLICGESDMRFYYEDDNDDSSSITFEHAGEERHDGTEASGAHVFCGNCGVHVFHADRSSGKLEVNANCLDAGGTKLIYRGQSSAGLSSISSSMHRGKMTPTVRSQSSLSSTMEAGSINDVEQISKIETVSENEPFLGNARFLESLDDNRSSTIPRKESVSSDHTQSESYSTSIVAENDDLSMGSSSITGASMPMHHSSLSVASGAASTNGRTDRTGLPPLPPFRISSSNRLPSSRISSSGGSVKTLPACLGDRPGYAAGRAGGGMSSGWSVMSMESSDLDGAEDVGNSTISPRMRDQMKKYMSRHMSQKGKTL